MLLVGNLCVVTLVTLGVLVLDSDPPVSKIGVVVFRGEKPQEKRTKE